MRNVGSSRNIVISLIPDDHRSLIDADSENRRISRELVIIRVTKYEEIKRAIWILFMVKIEATGKRVNDEI